MHPIVVIAASAGGFQPLRRIVAALPVPYFGAVFIVMHIGPNPSMLPSLLSRPNTFPAAFAQDGDFIEAGRIYVAPPDYHMILGADRIRLTYGPKVKHTRPAADPLFISAAEAFGKRVIGVVLSGGGDDGAAGLRAIKEHGGTALVQHPDDAVHSSMPRSALAAVHPDASLTVQEISQRIIASFMLL
jgi:two-component system chemotaxis response regulator CheB